MAPSCCTSSPQCRKLLDGAVGKDLHRKTEPNIILHPEPRLMGKLERYMCLNNDNAHFAANWLEKAFQKQAQRGSISKMLLVAEATLNIAYASKLTIFHRHTENMLLIIVDRMKQEENIQIDFIDSSLNCLEKLLSLNITSAGLTNLIYKYLVLLGQLKGNEQKKLIKVLCNSLGSPGILQILMEGNCINELLMMYQKGSQNGVSNEVIYLLGTMLVRTNAAEFSRLFIAILDSYLAPEIMEKKSDNIITRVSSCLHLMLKLTRGSLRQKDSSNILKPVQSLLSMLGTGVHTAINDIINHNSSRSKSKEWSTIIDVSISAIIGRCALEGLSMKTSISIDTMPLLRLSPGDEKWWNIYTAQTRVPFDIMDKELTDNYDRPSTARASIISEQSINYFEGPFYIAKHMDSGPSNTPEKISAGLSFSASDLEILLAAATNKVVEGQLRGKSSNSLVNSDIQFWTVFNLLSLFSYRASRTLDTNNLVTSILSSGGLMKKIPSNILKKQRNIQAKCAAICTLNTRIGKTLFRRVSKHKIEKEGYSDIGSFLLSFLSHIIKNSDLITRGCSAVILLCSLQQNEGPTTYLNELIALTEIVAKEEKAEMGCSIESLHKKVEKGNEDNENLHNGRRHNGSESETEDLLKDFTGIYSTVPSFQSNLYVLQRLREEEGVDGEESSSQYDEESAILLGGSMSSTDIDIESEGIGCSSPDLRTNLYEYDGPGRQKDNKLYIIKEENNEESGTGIEEWSVSHGIDDYKEYNDDSSRDSFGFPKIGCGTPQEQKTREYCKELIRSFSKKNYSVVDLYIFAVEFMVLGRSYGEGVIVTVLNSFLPSAFNGLNDSRIIITILLSLLKSKARNDKARYCCNNIISMFVNLGYFPKKLVEDEFVTKYVKFENLEFAKNNLSILDNVKKTVQKNVDNIEEAIIAIVMYIFDDALIDGNNDYADYRLEDTQESSESYSSTSVFTYRPSTITKDMLHGRASIYKNSDIVTLTTHSLSVNESDDRGRSSKSRHNTKCYIDVDEPDMRWKKLLLG